MVSWKYDKIVSSNILSVRGDKVISQILKKIFHAILKDSHSIDYINFNYKFKYVSVNFYNFELLV